jgi:predicted NBD/HSP70 family sugar kinase
MSNYFTGIEITEQYVKFRIADEDIKQQNNYKIAMPENMSPDQLLELLETGFYSLLKKSDISSDDVNAIAVSVPATINYKKGGIGCSSAIPLLNGMNIKENLTKKLKKFVVVETEANVRAFTEYKLGYTSNYKNFILIVLGKKISAGIYVNGWLVRNKDGSTSELGHIIIEPHGRKCPCSNRGCLESYASSDAIIRYFNKYKKIRSQNKITIEDIYKLAQKSDTAALDSFYRMGNYLGIALTTIINVISPEAIIFTGEVSKALKFFLPAVESTLNARAYSLPLNGIVYKRSTLGDDAGLIGLLHLAKDSYTKAYDLRLYDDIFAI